MALLSKTACLHLISVMIAKSMVTSTIEETHVIESESIYRAAFPPTTTNYSPQITKQSGDIITTSLLLYILLWLLFQLLIAFMYLYMRYPHQIWYWKARQGILYWEYQNTVYRSNPKLVVLRAASIATTIGASSASLIPIKRNRFIKGKIVPTSILERGCF